MLQLGHTRKNAKQVIIMTIAGIAVIIGLVVLTISYICYRIAFFSPIKNREAIPETKGKQFEPYRDTMRRIFTQLAARDYEDVTITSHDGLELAGKYYHIKDGAPLAIAFHGYRSCGMTDFAGGSELCFDMEHNLLLVDQRSHGKSQGRAITFGILERLDCLRWIHFAVSRFGADVQILLYGISMGATTVLMASALDLPKNVKAIVADCPYSSPSAIIKAVARKMHYPTFLAYPFIVLGAKIFGGFDLNATTAAEAVKKAQVPILIIHGEADGFVPAAMSEEVMQASPEMVKRVTFPGADHGISYLVDEIRYRKIVTEFISNVLK